MNFINRLNTKQRGAMVAAVLIATAIGTASLLAAPHQTNSQTIETVKFYAAAGDGNEIYTGNGGTNCDIASFNAARSAPNATSVDSTSSTILRWILTGCNANKKTDVARGFLSFDTSFIPDDATILSATVNLYVSGKMDNANDGNDFVTIVAGTQSSPDTLYAQDYGTAGASSNELSDRLDITNVSVSSYNYLTLNGSGLSNISKTSYTQFDAREGHDLLGLWPNYSKGRGNGIHVAMSETADTTFDPYLEVTYQLNDVDTLAPSVPVNLRATSVTSTQADLSWDAAVDNVGVNGYDIYRDGTLVSSVASTLYTDQNLVPETSYSYEVSAYDTQGNVSGLSDALAITTPPGPPPDTESPSVPVSLQGFAVSSSSIDLAWEPSVDNVGVSGYYVYRDGALAAQTVDSSYHDSALSPETMYTYAVSAFDAAGNVSNQSAEVQVTTLPAPPIDTEPPSVPVNVQGLPSSYTAIDLSWDPSKDNVGVAGYMIFRDNALLTSIPTNSYHNANLVPNTSYLYSIVAYDQAGNVSGHSSEVMVTTTAITGTIGYVGCSMTLDADDGYWKAGGKKFWQVNSRYGGGTIGAWVYNLGDSSQYWNAFQTMLSQHSPPSVIWWQLCTKLSDISPNSYDNAVVVLNEIKRRAPNVPVFVSAQPDYTEGHVCEKAGLTGPQDMSVIASDLVSNGLASQGPLTGPLTPLQLRDSCHANTDGKGVLGNQLAGFFGL